MAFRLSSAENVPDTRARLDAELVRLGVQRAAEVVALLADGHLLVEGAPGLAKTRAISSLAGAIAVTAALVARHQPAPAPGFPAPLTLALRMLGQAVPGCLSGVGAVPDAGWLVRIGHEPRGDRGQRGGRLFHGRGARLEGGLRKIDEAVRKIGDTYILMTANGIEISTGHLRQVAA